MAAVFSPDFEAYASGEIPIESVRCALCGNNSCVCPPFGHPAYFVLTDFRHGKITSDDPEFQKYFKTSK